MIERGFWMSMRGVAMHRPNQAASIGAASAWSTTGGRVPGAAYAWAPMRASSSFERPLEADGARLLTAPGVWHVRIRRRHPRHG
jgi:hypothetical protein